MIRYKLKLEEYHQKALEYLEGLEQGTIVLESKGDPAIDESELASYKKVLREKIENLEKSISLISGQINMLILAKTNHTIIKDKLVLYQGVLLPSINNGVTINSALKTQNASLTIDKKMLEIFANIWTSNITETLQILESLSETSLSAERIESIRNECKKIIDREIIDVESSEIIDSGEDEPILKLTAKKKDE